MIKKKILYNEYIKNSYLFSENFKYLENINKLNLNNKIPIINKSKKNIFLNKNIFYKKNEKKYININKITSIIDLKIKRLIDNYRYIGYNNSNINPLKDKYNKIKELELNYYNFKKSDFKKTLNVNYTFFNKKKMSLNELFNALNKVYSDSISINFTYISNTVEIIWLQKKLEQSYNYFSLSKKKKKHILKKLIIAESWEKYISTKYIGQKRFSLEGSEGLIVMLDEIINYSSKIKIKEIVIGTTHRGRLNILTNILGKKPKSIFNEFDDIYDKYNFCGDVKYHKGYSSNILTKNGILNLYLLFNPSHLEIINPIVEGLSKALILRNKNKKEKNKENILTIIIHGDASFVGQGVVTETFNLSKTKDYNINGTIHIIINNQIGFTTTNIDNFKSILNYPNIAKITEIPVLQVNSDNPESIILATQIAISYKIKFKKDIIIDLICFRKLGHNEQDTPSLTQPLMYKKISRHTSVINLYNNQLIDQKIVSKNYIKKIIKNYISLINCKNKQITGFILNKNKFMYSKNWKKFLNKKINNKIITSIDLKKLKFLSKKITNIPSEFKIHKLVKKIINNRINMGNEKLNVDWGMSEHLAYATLLISGFNIRLSGQDSKRGTFSHRHAVIYDQNNNKAYIPLQNISKDQFSFQIINSILSEEAVLGFEYGFSIVEPNNLTIWEAQFGDFSNVAQVVIDQFISSAEKKWKLKSAIVLMLPHGYEGQGPEHSSARLERYLQLCANDNIQIVQPTMSIQLFHLLRRQMIGNFRKPLIIMMPKSLLRNKKSSSSLSEIAVGKFQNIIEENFNNINNKNITCIIMCSGKIYFDIIKEKKNRDIYNIIIIRIEQLYPFPNKEFSLIIKKFSNLKKIIWVQDEPKNQGAWFYIKNHIYKKINNKQILFYVGRPYSASTATGCYKEHCIEQNKIIKELFFLI